MGERKVVRDGEIGCVPDAKKLVDRKTYTINDEREFIDGIGKFNPITSQYYWVDRTNRHPRRSRIWLLKKYYETTLRGYCGLKREKFLHGVGREVILKLVSEAIYTEGGSI